MSDVVIKVENLSKRYRLGLINHGMLSKDLQSWWARLRGKEDPNTTINNSPQPSLSQREGADLAGNDEIYALKDINFEVKQGEVLGIIGANGAGKSTLLKILSRVTAPTTGSIKIKGRIGSLLEVGTGFHPELTGRENIYLNGAILGMRRWDIDKKLDEIIDFSGVEKFIDTPVKRYSSGMYVRLAFAVAAHLDPEILVVDEVLAVGDAEFQKKCLGKMGDVSKKEGRTVLFVSHNMTAVKRLCNNSVLLYHGKMKTMGNSIDIVEEYLDRGLDYNKYDLLKRKDIHKKRVFFKTIRFLNSDNKEIDKVQTGKFFKLDISLFKNSEEIKGLFSIGVQVYDHNGNYLSVFNMRQTGIEPKVEDLPKKFNCICVIPKMPLMKGRYILKICANLNNESEVLDKIDDGIVLEVVEGDYFNNGVLFKSNKNGVFILNKWEVR